ncbi:hypothetical protein BC835DRAFT_1311403 [Cytidiella melzeri]|nr:hypothetical protein BC835DRAFT_1311403 [Cytidiella melzeri]
MKIGACVDEVFAAEDDTAAAVAAIESLRARNMSTFPNQNIPPQITTTVPASTPTFERPVLPQLQDIEADLSEAVEKLCSRRRIRGTALTLEEMLNPIEELQIGKEEFSFPGGDADIITEVQNTLNPPEAIEVDDSDDDETEDDKISVSAAIDVCKMMERLCIEHVGADGFDPLVLQGQVRRFRGHLHREITSRQKQTTLDAFFPVP